MFEERIEKERFNVNRGRDAFIDRILSIPNPITEDDKEEISKLLKNL
jgi:hypothetical protein